MRSSDTDRLTPSSVSLSLLLAKCAPSRSSSSLASTTLVIANTTSTLLAYLDAPSLFRSIPLSGNLIISSPCPTPIFPFVVRSLRSVSFSRSLTIYFLSLSPFHAFTHSDFSSRSRYLDYITSSSSPLRADVPGTWLRTIPSVRLSPSIQQYRSLLRRRGPSLSVPRRDYYATVLFSLPLRARVSDNFRFSAQWLSTATAQPAPRTRISTCDQRFQPRNSRAARETQRQRDRKKVKT